MSRPQGPPTPPPPRPRTDPPPPPSKPAPVPPKPVPAPGRWQDWAPCEIYGHLFYEYHCIDCGEVQQ